jgi:calcineurin-like phosphoesterase family protein
LAVLYTSDLHIGHEKVAGERGFGSTDAHDAAMAELWCAQVRRTDIVWVLGDLSPDLEAGLDWVAKLPGTKHLITGNHDPAFPGNRGSHKVQRAYLEHFRSVQLAAQHTIAGTPVYLSHFPVTIDRPGKRERFWKLRDEGQLLLHGHTHSTQRLTSPRELHVGVDAWSRLVTRDDVVELLGLPRATMPT